MSARYYFFTDANQAAPGVSNYIHAQDPTQAYGPVTVGAAPGMDEYRVTSVHSATFSPTAYAVCDAILCVQNVPNTALVNIVLKPLVQPALNFAPLKYIIYKGILASSLINATEVAAYANNRLTKLAWDVQARKNKSAGTTANPPAEALGIGSTGTSFADTDPIDNLFYRSGAAFQLPVVRGGWSIGQFDQARFGMEVLMDGLAFQHPLSLARQIESKIRVPTLADDATGAQIFDHWHAKEQILGFMDPCAFHGSFFRAGLWAKTSGNVPFAAKAGRALYQDVLFPFTSRNKVYLDIRNEHNFSLNYFKNYATTTGGVTAARVKIGNTAVDYYGSKWPMLTLTAASFPSNKKTGRNVFALQLPVGDKGDNPKPLVYVSQGYRDIHVQQKDDFPAELTSSERFFADFKPPAGGYTVALSAFGTRSLTLAVPNIAGQDGTTPVSCYIRLKYFKREPGSATASTAIRSLNFLDNLYYPLDLRILLEGPAKIKSAVYDEEVYVNAQDEGGLEFDFIGKVGIARDTWNTSFFVLPTAIRTETGPTSAHVALTGETSDYKASYPELVALKSPLVRVRKSELRFSDKGPVPVAEFAPEGTAAERAKFNTPDFTKFFMVTVANAAFDTWKSKVAAAQGAGFRTYLGVRNLETLTDGVEVQFRSFELVLRTFVRDESTGAYTVTEVGTDPGSLTGNIKVHAPC